MINTEVIQFLVTQTSIGSVLIAVSEKGVCAISLGDNAAALRRELQNDFPGSKLVEGDDNFKRIAKKVIKFLEAPGRGLDLPLDIRGTAFQRKVWGALCKIPRGSTASYTDVATRIGAPKSVRAVASACAANLISVVIPCHRVVRSDGSISGYRWGADRKRSLLKSELAAK